MAGAEFNSLLQDFLTTSFLLTSKDVFYSRSTFCQLVGYLGDACEYVDLPTPAILKPLELWTGKQLFSMLVRPNAATRSVALTRMLAAPPAGLVSSMLQPTVSRFSCDWESRGWDLRVSACD